MRISLRKSKVFIIVLAVVLLVVLVNVFQKEVRGFFYWFSAPIQKVLWGAGERSADFLFGIFSQGYLKQELNKLELRNQELLVQVENLKDLEQENEILRKALEIGLQKEFKLSLAQIIGKDISQDFILINKGSEDGIFKDMPVITEQKVLVGRIYQVYEDFSKVQLIFHKDSIFDTDIGVVKGQGNFKILLNFVSKEKDIFKGDIVKTSALGGFFPQGLLVGEIKEVKKSDIEPFQKAEINPAFDISKAGKLFVILKF